MKCSNQIRLWNRFLILNLYVFDFFVKINVAIFSLNKLIHYSIDFFHSYLILLFRIIKNTPHKLIIRLH
jgi:hypothetical protein